MKNGKVIKGQVQATGVSFDGHIGREYAHVTFVENDGNIVRLPSVTVPPLQKDFFCPGLEGEFYFHTHGKRNTLLAMKNGSRKVFHIDDAKRVFSNHFQKHLILLFVAAFCLLIFAVGLIGSEGGPFVFGFFTSLPMLFFVYQTRIGARYLRPKHAEQLVRDLGFN